LRFEKPQQQFKVQADALQLRQALSNLISNAIKYTPAKGAITISLKQEANRVTINVQDSGYGIQAADLPFIFDRFYRVHDDHQDEIEGNGLGLAIVKSIAERHGGQVSVESKAGQGSCFSFTLPLGSEQ
jgi:signal transduction histidine kinase